MAARGAFRSYLLEHQGRPTAFVIGTQVNGCYNYEQLAYDPAYAAHSPGTVLLFRLLEDLIARDPPRVLDFGDGEAEYKRLFANAESRSGPVILARRGLGVGLAMRAEHLSVTLGRWGRAGPPRRDLRAAAADVPAGRGHGGRAGPGGGPGGRGAGRLARRRVTCPPAADHPRRQRHPGGGEQPRRLRHRDHQHLEAPAGHRRVQRVDVAIRNGPK